MTAYFDRMHETLGRLRAEARSEDGAKVHAAAEQARAAVDRMLLEVQLCTCLPGFPESVRDAVQLTIARRSPEPLSLIDLDDPHDDMRDTFERWDRLTWDLHTVFHDLAGMGLERFCDKPDSILHGHANALEERRIALMRERPEEFAAVLRRHDEMAARLAAELARP